MIKKPFRKKLCRRCDNWFLAKGKFCFICEFCKYPKYSGFNRSDIIDLRFNYEEEKKEKSVN